MRKIGFITIGQSPRRDIMKDIESLLLQEIEIFQRGALDGLSEEELLEVQPSPGQTVLASTLADGRAVIMAEEKILPYLQRCINDLERDGVDSILFLCTGDFGDVLSSKVPLLYPNRILNGLIPAICGKDGLIVFTPEETQKEEAARQWAKAGIKAEVMALSPYDGKREDFVRAGEAAALARGRYILLDCMGYSAEMKAVMQDISGKRVILPRTMAAAILREL